MKRYLPIVAAVVVLALGTLAHGIYTERWLRIETDQLRKFTERIPKVPLKVGDWSGTEDPVNMDEFKLTNCTKCVQRTYKNSNFPQPVSIYLVSGTASHICRHSPDWCYRNAGFVQQGPLTNYSVSVEGLDTPVEFCTAVFRKNAETSGPRNLRIFWTYAHNGNWRGPAWAKLAYPGRPALYKIYLIVPVGEEKNAVGDTPTDDFAKALFPVMNKVLFTEEGADTDSTPAEDQPTETSPAAAKS